MQELNPKEKAISLVDEFRVMLMQEDTNCCDEMLCTAVAKMIVNRLCNEILSDIGSDRGYAFWYAVKEETNKI